MEYLKNEVKAKNNIQKTEVNDGVFKDKIKTTKIKINSR